jgi:hypothetical protein
MPEFTPSTALFLPPPLIPGTVSAGIIFAFTYMCVHYLCHIHPPAPFPVPPAPRAEPAPPSCYPMLYKKKT